MASMTFDKSARYDRAAIRSELIAAGAKFAGGGNTCLCPFHDDKSPSGSIYVGMDGAWHYKCHACQVRGDIFDLRAKIKGVPLPQIFRDSDEVQHETPKGVELMSRVYSSLDEILEIVKRRGTVEHIYKYHAGVDYALKFVVIRYVKPDGKKSFSQATKVTDGWLNSGPPKPMPLYNLESVTRAKTVIVVEGEKCVEALIECGHVATTSAGGAANAESTYWEPLSGKVVYLWPDNDDNGKKYINSVLNILKGFETPPIVYIINPDEIGLTEKQDAYDYINSLGTTNLVIKHQAVDDVLKKADSTGPSSRVNRRIMEQVDGTRKAIHWKWDLIGNFTKALLPGSITMVCGTPGSSKSFFLLESMMYWHSEGIPVSMMALEEDQAYHLHRCVAMLCRNSDILDPDWSHNNQREAIDLWREAEPFIDGFGDKIFECPNPHMSYTELIKWVIDRIKAKCRIIGVDPISALDTGDKNSWNEDKRFILEVGNVLSKSDSSLILITHPRGGKYNEVDLQNIQGGSAFARFTQTAIWIETLPERRAYEIKKHNEINQTVMCNRVVKILKARNGRGAGAKIAYDFNSDSLSFAELGLIVKEPKRQRDE